MTVKTTRDRISGKRHDPDHAELVAYLRVAIEEGYRSVTLTCVRNNRGIDVAALVKQLRAKHHLVLDGGYGRIKGETLRLSNMGDETVETVAHLLACLDDCLG